MNRVSKKVKFGGTDFEVPPLPVEALRVVVPGIMNMRKLEGGERYLATLDVAVKGLAVACAMPETSISTLAPTDDEILAVFNVLAEQAGFENKTPKDTAVDGTAPLAPQIPAAPLT